MSVEKVSEVLPCPFCGSKVEVSMSTQVHCSNTTCPMSQYYMHDTYWNNRVELQSLRNLPSDEEIEMYLDSEYPSSNDNAMMRTAIRLFSKWLRDRMEGK
jgi:hypothetical protein